MKLSDEKREQILFWLSTSTSSLEAPVGEDSEAEVKDLIEDETSAAPDAAIENVFNKERIGSLLGVMGKRERAVLDMRFGLMDGRTYTLAEVAKKLGVSRERVRQIEEKALKRLRKFAGEQGKEL
jgi:RNA polymerase primary sigma factor